MVKISNNLLSKEEMLSISMTITMHSMIARTSMSQKTMMKFPKRRVQEPKHQVCHPRRLREKSWRISPTIWR